MIVLFSQLKKDPVFILMKRIEYQWHLSNASLDARDSR